VLNISAPTVVKPGPGSVVTVSVLAAGGDAGGIYDFASTGGYDATTQVGTIPQQVGFFPANSFPCFTAILVVPGTGQVVSVAFS